MAGGICNNFMFKQTISRIGYAWTTRMMGLVALATFIVAIRIVILRSINVSGKRRAVFDVQALKELPFLTMCVEGFFRLLGYFTHVFFIPTFAQTALKTSEATSLNLLILYHAVSLSRKIRRLGSLNVHISNDPTDVLQHCRWYILSDLASCPYIWRVRHFHCSLWTHIESFNDISTDRPSFNMSFAQTHWHWNWNGNALGVDSFCISYRDSNCCSALGYIEWSLARAPTFQWAHIACRSRPSVAALKIDSDQAEKPKCRKAARLGKMLRR